MWLRCVSRRLAGWLRLRYADWVGQFEFIYSTLLAWLIRRPQSFSPFVPSLAFGLILTVSQAPAAGALRCFEKNHETGLIEINDDPRLLYCGVSPALWKHAERNASNYGLGVVNDELSPYEEVFKHRAGGYDVLTICLFEKQDFRRLAVTAHVEFTFRCVCNYNLCNGPLLFTNYLRGLELQAQLAAEFEDLRSSAEPSKSNPGRAGGPSLFQLFGE